MSLWNPIAFACVLALTCVSCLAETPRTEFEQSFIGREFIDPPSDQCEPLGGFMLQSNESSSNRLSVDSLRCGDRELELLGRFLTNYARDNKVKVLDALLLPKLKPGEQLFQNGDCELNGKIDSDFFVVARLGKRDKVTWKNGVRAAWLINPETGKFEELPTKNIVCWRPTPP
jgi:hypothetical protein